MVPAVFPGQGKLEAAFSIEFFCGMEVIQGQDGKGLCFVHFVF